MNNLLKGGFYLSYLYLIVSFVLMLSGISSIVLLPDVYVSYLGSLVFFVNIIILFVYKEAKKRKTLDIFFLLICFFSIIHRIASSNPPTIASILSFTVPLSIGIVFEIVLRRKILDDDKIKNLFVLFFVGTCFLFFFYKFSSYYSISGGAIHAVYFIVVLLPIVFIIKNDIYKYIAIFVSLIISVLSFKRGAIISVILISFVFITLRLFEANKKEKLFNVILLFGVFLAVQYYYGQGSRDLEYTIKRFENLENDGGSGREELFNYFIDEINHFSMIDHVFGRGAKATSSYYDNLTAHNDWLELYFDYGVICFMLWGLFWLNNIYKCLKTIKEKNQYTPMYASIIIAYCVMSMVSHVMIYSYSSIVMIYLSYINYKLDENRHSYLS